MDKSQEPVDYMNLMAQAAEEDRADDWTNLFPEPQGGIIVDYAAIADAWETERERMGFGKAYKKIEKDI